MATVVEQWSSIEGSPPPTQTAQPTVVVEDTSGVSLGVFSGQDIFFDDASGLIHIVEGRMVSAFEIPVSFSQPPPPPPAPWSAPAPPLTSDINPISMEDSSSSSTVPAPVPAAADSMEEKQNVETLRGVTASPSPSPLPPRASPGVVRHARSMQSTTSSDSSDTPTRAFLVSEGPPITAVRAALDGSATALQRSARHIEFLHHASGNMFVAAPETRDADLRGFFWTECPGAEFVMVTSHGLELFSLPRQRQGLRLTGVQGLSSLRWFIWSHACRVLVAGCGAAGAKLQPFQFTPSGIVRLPLLDLTPPWGSPTKATSSPTPSPSSPQWLLVSPSRVWVLLMYQRVFIAHHDTASGLLRLYRLYKDATALRAEIFVQGFMAQQNNRSATSPGSPVNSSHYAASVEIELSVVDNVLVVHMLGDGTVILYDTAEALMLGGGGGDVPVRLGPICPPSPMGMAPASVPETSSGGGGGGGSACRLELHHPDVALDPSTGRVFVLKLDLQAVAMACSDPAGALKFILRRRRSAAPHRDPPHVAMGVLRRVIADDVHQPQMQTLRAVFDAIHAATALETRHLRRGASEKEPRGPGGDRHDKTDGNSSGNSWSLGQLDEEFIGGILKPLLFGNGSEKKTVNNADVHTTTTCLYVQAALAELLASCCAFSVPVSPAVVRLYLQVYCMRGQQLLLPGLLQSHAPLLDSVEIAVALEEWASVVDGGAIDSYVGGRSPASVRNCASRHGDQNKKTLLKTHPQPSLALGLAQEMWTRIGEPVAACRLLLRQGRIVKSLREIKMHKLEGTMVAQECLDAAHAVGDAVLVRAAERVF